MRQARMKRSSQATGAALRARCQNLANVCYEKRRLESRSKDSLSGNLANNVFTLRTGFVRILNGIHSSVAELFDTLNTEGISELVEGEEGMHQVATAAKHDCEIKNDR